MSEALLLALIRLAMDAPHLAEEVRAMAKHQGVTDAQWEDAAHIIAQDPASYFAGKLTPQPTPGGDTPPTPKPQPDASIYARLLKTLPIDQLKRGDRIWTSPNQTLFWVRGNNDGQGIDFVPPGAATYFGWYDGTRIVPASEDPSDAPRT